MKFKILIFLIPFLSLLHGQRGPQDTWYETARVPMPSGCSPHDLIVTPEGTLLLTDTNNEKIHELEANGTLIRSFGAPGSGNGQFNNPVELAMGPNNRIYVTDQDNHRIQVLERDGTFVKAFGTNGTGDGQFNQPRGLGISLDNEVFVSEVSNHRVQVFDADGNFLRKWGSLGNLDGQMNKPYSLEVDEDRKVFVTDNVNNRINVFSKTGELLYKIGTLRYFYHSVSFLKLLPSGILATGGETTGYEQDLLSFREKNGASLKTKNFGHDYYKGTWSPSTQFDNGTIVFAHRFSNNLIFLEQTYRTLKPATPQNLPLVDIISVKQPAGTDHLEIKYKITDTDSSTVNCGLLAFKDGGNDLSKLIIPSTFVGSTTGKLGPSTTTGTTHTVTWDAAADWDVLFGDVEIAVVAQDDRELMNFHFLTLPATDTNSTELKISRSPLSDNDLLQAWYTLLALGDSGTQLVGSSIAQTWDGPAPSFSPDDLSDLLVWLDANDLDADPATSTYSNGTVVETWANKANGQGPFSQATVSSRPILHTNVLNGKAGVLFDDVDDGLSSDVQINQNPYTVAILFNCLNRSNASRRAIQGSNNWLIGPYGNRIGYHPNDGWASHTLQFVAERFYLAVAVTTDQGSKFLVDGVDVTQTASSNRWPGYLHLGASGASPSQKLNGYINEVIAYRRELTVTEIANLSDYIIYKWGVGATRYVDNSTTTAAGRQYLFNKMNLREATAAEIERAKEGATPGVINKFEPSHKVGPDERPNKVNEYGFDTGGSGFWVVDANPGGTHTAQLSSDVSLEMIWVEPGTFTMGQSDISSASPEHEVTLTQGFYLGKYEVTQAQYEAVMTGNTDGLSAIPSNWPNNPDRPVEKVSWEDIQKFLTRLNAQQAGNIPEGWAYVLPTEAQWEYACRAGTTTAYSWGDSITTDNANYSSSGYSQTRDVGLYDANPWGFFDMHGNVWEWTADAHASYATGAQTDPFNVGTTGSYRVIRGGSWTNSGTLLRSALRSGYYPSPRFIYIGFRVGFQQQ